MPDGVLYLVGVPIGNYEDMTFRAVETLKNVDIIAAEDTRRAKRLLSHFAITPKRLLSHHAHNEQDSAPALIEELQKGLNIALMTDAGMPSVSDPGYYLTSQAQKVGVQVKVIPGVSAVPTALAVSGLPAEDFRFTGFLPRKKGQREKTLEGLKSQPSTLVFFESPRRTIETLQDLHSHLGNREACLCRELTKTHEEVLQKPLEELIWILENRDEVLGEVTLVVAGASDADTQLGEAALEKLILAGLEKGKNPKTLRDEIAERHGLRKKDVYDKIISLK